jgi:hypothetical protein
LQPCIDLPVANECSNPEYPDLLICWAGSTWLTISVEVVQLFNIPSSGIVSAGFHTSPEDKEWSKIPFAGLQQPG